MVVSLLGNISAAHHGCLPTNSFSLRRNWYELVLVSDKWLSLGISLIQFSLNLVPQLGCFLSLDGQHHCVFIVSQVC